MMRVFRLSIFVLFISALLGSSFLYAYAYSPDATHYPFAEKSAELYNTFYDESQLSEEEKIWIAQGASDEDTPSLRVLHHFYDPINNEGLQGFESSKEWAHDAGLQSLNRFQFGGERRIFTWEEAIASYQQGDKEHAYKTLGHILHLVQDATVPAHARQDPHLHAEIGPFEIEGYGGPDPYESASAELSVSSIDIRDMSPVLLASIDEYFESVATYTNTHFLSKDSLGFYEEPGITRIDPFYIYGEDRMGEYRLVKIIGHTQTKLFQYDLEFYFDDPLVVQDYWSRLAPVAIENGAGIIKLFHDTVEQESFNAQQEQGGLSGFVSRFWGGIVHRTRSFVEISLFAFARHALDISTYPVAMLGTGPPPQTIDRVPQTYQEQREQEAAQRFAQQLAAVTENFQEELGQALTEDTETKSLEQSLFSSAQEAPEGPGGALHLVTRVIDGDTIELENGEHVRYIGINAPEMPSSLATPGVASGGCFALEATDQNSALVLNQYVFLEEGPNDRDLYGRLLRYIWKGNTLVNKSLIESGHVYAYDFGFSHKFSKLFETLEEQAKKEELGLWGDVCNLQDESLEQEEGLGGIQKDNDIGATLGPSEGPNVAPILINEIRMQTDEFVELYNPTDRNVSLADYYFSYYPKTRDSWDDPSFTKSFLEDALIVARGFYLIAFGGAVLENNAQADWQPYASDKLAGKDGSVALSFGDPREEGSVRVDAFGWGDVTLAEYASFIEKLEKKESAARVTNHADLDNDNNRFDFSLTAFPTPGAENQITPRVNEVASSSTITPAQVVISEVAVNGSEFVELYNASTSPQDLSGHYVAYYSSTRSTWDNALSAKLFPDNTIIPVGAYFVVGLNDYEGKESYPVADWTPGSFTKLSNSSGTVALFPFNPKIKSANDAQEGIVDAVGWGNVQLAEPIIAPSPTQAPSEGESTSRDEAGTDTDNNTEDFVIAIFPTPGSGPVQEDEEQVPPDHLVINEIQISDAEFIELYNPTDEALSLEGYYFSYYSSSRELWDDPYRNKAFPTEATIASEGYYLIGLKDYPTSNGNPDVDWQPYTSAQLSNSKGTIALFSEDPKVAESPTPIDAVAWGSISSDLKEDTPASVPPSGKSISRNTNHVDTDNNTADFTAQDPTPTNASSGIYIPDLSGTPLWASYQNTPHNTGGTENKGPGWNTSEDVNIVWSAILDGIASSPPQPVIDSQGNIYIASGESITSFTPVGEERWDYALDEGVVVGGLALAADSSRLYVSADALITLRTSNGAFIASTELSGSGVAMPIVEETSESAYVATLEKIYAFDKDGEEFWTRTWYQDVWDYKIIRASQPIIEGDRLYIIANTATPAFSYLFAFDVSTGELDWKSDLKAANAIWKIEGSPSLNSQGTLLVGYKAAFSRRGIAAFDIENEGAFKWKIQFGGKKQFNLPPAIDDQGFIYAYPGNQSVILHRLEENEEENGATLFYSFVIENGSKITTTTIIDSKGVIYLGTEDGTLYAISPNSTATEPEIFWQYEFGEEIQHLVLGDGVVYVVTDTNLYALGE